MNYIWGGGGCLLFIIPRNDHRVSFEEKRRISGCWSVIEIFYIFARVPEIEIGSQTNSSRRYIVVFVAISVDVNTDGDLTLRLWFPQFFLYIHHIIRTLIKFR